MCRSSRGYQRKLFELPALAGSVECSMAQVALRTKNSANGPDSSNVSIDSAVQETSHEPSRSHSESPDSINLVAHSTLASEVNIPVGDEDGDSKKMLGTDEDREASQNWETVSDLASDIARAARNALFSRRKIFKKVVAVITYWETAIGLEHLRKNADKLGRLFRDSFKFDVLVYRIPENVPNRKFVSTISDELDKVAEDPDSLFILYYGGHASMGDFNNLRLWKKEHHHLSANIEWSSAQRTLFANEVICSKLFLFDCCHAGAMIDPSLKWQTSCELLGACAADVEASAMDFSSFTEAFLKEISKNTYAIWELHSALCSTENRRNYNLNKFPFYQDFIGHQSDTASTVLREVGSADESQDRPQRPSDKLLHLDTITEAVICVAIDFGCSAEAFVKDIEAIQKDWTRWFKFSPTEADDITVKECKGPKLLAAFESNSCITIWSFPIWLWDVMAPLSGFQHIGTIQPQNLALAASGTQTDLPVLDCSSRMIVGEASPSRRPSKPDKVLLLQDRPLEAQMVKDGLQRRSRKQKKFVDCNIL